jgi:hypothetical protein
LLRDAGATAMKPAASSAMPANPKTIRDAIAQALSRLQPADPVFYEHTKCISCHHQSLPAAAATLARSHGLVVEGPPKPHGTDIILNDWGIRREQLLLGYGPGSGMTYDLLALAEARVPSNPVTDAMALRLAAAQESNGSWELGDSLRPPLVGSPIEKTALAIRVLRVYAPPGLTQEIRKRLGHSRDFLKAAVPGTTQDHAFRLLGLVWSQASPAEIATQRQRLIALQRSDGGWSQWPTMTSDAYATGQALYALHASGTSPMTDVHRRGAQYLLRAQLEDGTWWVHSRAIGFQPYFETGFPHGRDQFISAAATAWAVIGLAPALDDERLRR